MVKFCKKCGSMLQMGVCGLCSRPKSDDVGTKKCQTCKGEGEISVNSDDGLIKKSCPDCKGKVG